MSSSEKWLKVIDATEIPVSLNPIKPMLQLFLLPILMWLSQVVYDHLLKQTKKHELVRLKDTFDFSVLEAACADYHHSSGKGRPPTHTVDKLIRALLVKYLYDYSLREMEHQLRCNLLVKWFVGYHLFDTSPDHNTLHNFEQYIYQTHARLYFDTTLRQIDRQFPTQREQSQIGDTYALRADAALESLIERLRHSGCRLLWALQSADSDLYELVQVSRHMLYLLGKDKATPLYHLTATEKQARLEYTIRAVHLAQDFVQMHTHPEITVWVTHIDKILADELAVEFDDFQQVSRADKLSKEKRGSYRICSATDPEATIRNHGPGKQDFGYNISVAATIDFIREIQADTGSQPDPIAIPGLLAAQEANHSLLPSVFIYDQIAGTGKTVDAVEKISDGQTQLVAKPMPDKQSPEQFTPRDFVLSDNAVELTCPSGQYSALSSRSEKGEGTVFRFSAEQCFDCPLLRRCRGQNATPTSIRHVFISDYRLPFQRLIEFSQTDTFKELMKLRPHIERIIAGLVLHNGARRARFRGLVKVDFQVKMAATAYNIKRWLKKLTLEHSGAQFAAFQRQIHFKVTIHGDCRAKYVFFSPKCQLMHPSVSTASTVNWLQTTPSTLQI